MGSDGRGLGHDSFVVAVREPSQPTAAESRFVVCSLVGSLVRWLVAGESIKPKRVVVDAAGGAAGCLRQQRFFIIILRLEARAAERAGKTRKIEERVVLDASIRYGHTRLHTSPIEMNERRL